MGIKKYTAYTPSRRHMTGSDFAEITKSTPEKSLVVSKKNNAGRNAQGKITVRHRGGGSRRKLRIIDFKRNAKDGIPAKVVAIEYDPNRTANIALICYADGEKAYILAPAGLKVGETVMSGEHAEAKVGMLRRRSATACPWQTSRSAQRSTLLRCTRARALSWQEQRASPHSSWQRKASTRPCVFRPAR